MQRLLFDVDVVVVVGEGDDTTHVMTSLQSLAGQTMCAQYIVVLDRPWEGGAQHMRVCLPIMCIYAATGVIYADD